eukprot:6466952-Amphidinium_carterae.1
MDFNPVQIHGLRRVCASLAQLVRLQVALNWVIAQGAVAIAGAKNRSQAEECSCIATTTPADLYARLLLWIVEWNAFGTFSCLAALVSGQDMRMKR